VKGTTREPTRLSVIEIAYGNSHAIEDWHRLFPEHALPSVPADAREDNPSVRVIDAIDHSTPVVIE